MEEHPLVKFEHWVEGDGMWSGDFHFRSLILSFLSVSQLELLKKGVFGQFMDLVDVRLSDSIFHCLILSQLASSNDSALKFKIFDRACVFDSESFRLITGWDSCVGDFSVVSSRPNRLLRLYFPNQDRIRLCDLKSFLQIKSSNRTGGFWERSSDPVRLAEVYILERVLLGCNEKCVVKGHLMKIIDDDSLRVSYPWGSLSFNWLVWSIRGCVKTFKSMPSTRFMISGFPYALNVWLLEVFPIFRGFLSFHGLKSPRMLSWGPSKQVDYKVITDNFFHAEKRFKKFIVHAVVVGTEQEMLDYSVALKFPDDSGPCSSRAVLPSEVTSQIVDGVLSSVKKQLDDERSTIVNQVKSLDSRFEELDKNFVGAINAMDSLVRVHDETKSGVAASESAKRTCLESRLDSLEIKFDYVMHCVESLVRLHSENKPCKACASGKRQPDLGYSVNDEVKLDAHLGKDLQERMENMLCKARSTKNETSPMLDMLCHAVVSSSSQLSDKTQTLSQFEKEYVKENEDLAKKKKALKEIAAINDAFQRGDYLFSSNEASQNVNEVAAAVEDSRKRPRCEDGNKEDDGSRKRLRCKDGNKEDDGYPNWYLLTPSSTPVEKRLSSAAEDIYCTAEELGK